MSLGTADWIRDAAPVAFVAVPSIVAFAATTLTAEGERTLALAVLLALITGAGNLVATRVSSSAVFLPLVRVGYKATGAVLLAATLGLLAAFGDLGPASWPEGTVLLVLVCSLALPLPGPFHQWAAHPLRLAVIGSAEDTASLRRDLAAGKETGFEVVGRIAVEHESFAPGPPLGMLDTLSATVEAYRIDLLLVGPGAPRMEVFTAASRMLLGRSVRMMELVAFYEAAFGQVPLNAINDSWFQCLLHPEHRSRSSLSRALDAVVAAAATVVFAPVIAVCALLIRRDGGPAFYTQTRIGEGGEPFMIYKLRTMRPSDGPTPWTTAQDDRVTKVGRFLRRTHLDELPQLLNVLRGDMSIVGPRPEQPEIVDSLERIVPFYNRRHYARPGVTGWAQIRCGYAGSNVGSAWKASQDLYYAKHRSFALDLMILVETVRTLVMDHQYGVEPPGTTFLLPEEHQHADERAPA